jgi:choline dehydrogenase-like flavoprotein
MCCGIPPDRKHEDAGGAAGSWSVLRSREYVEWDRPWRSEIVGVPGGLGIHHNPADRARRRGSSMSTREGTGRVQQHQRLVHTRGHASTYDAWESQGATGWDYQAMLPNLQRSEHTEGRDPRVRGTTGPMRIEQPPPANPFAQALYRAAIEAGYPETGDINGTQGEGVSWLEQNVVGNRRQSAADAYLLPVLSRSNLTVVTDAYVLRGTC